MYNDSRFFRGNESEQKSLQPIDRLIELKTAAFHNAA